MRFRSGVSELQASWFDSPGLQSFSFKKALNPWLFLGGKSCGPDSLMCLLGERECSQSAFGRTEHVELHQIPNLK